MGAEMEAADLKRQKQKSAGNASHGSKERHEKCYKWRYNDPCVYTGHREVNV